MDSKIWLINLTNYSHVRSYYNVPNKENHFEKSYNCSSTEQESRYCENSNAQAVHQERKTNKHYILNQKRKSEAIPFVPISYFVLFSSKRQSMETCGMANGDTLWNTRKKLKYLQTIVRTTLGHPLLLLVKMVTRACDGLTMIYAHMIDPSTLLAPCKSVPPSTPVPKGKSGTGSAVCATLKISGDSCFPRRQLTASYLSITQPSGERTTHFPLPLWLPPSAFYLNPHLEAPTMSTTTTPFH